jgi:hypothetical protein
MSEQQYSNIFNNWNQANKQLQKFSTVFKSMSCSSLPSSIEQLSGWYKLMHQLREYIPINIDNIHPHCKTIYKLYNDILVKTYNFLDQCKYDSQLNEYLHQLLFVLNNQVQYTSKKIFNTSTNSSYNVSSKSVDVDSTTKIIKIHCYRSDDVQDEDVQLPVQIYHKYYMDTKKCKEELCAKFQIMSLLFCNNEQSILYPKFQFDEFSRSTTMNISSWYRALYNKCLLSYNKYKSWFHEDRIKYMKCIKQYMTTLQAYKIIVQFIQTNYPYLLYICVESNLIYDYDTDAMMSNSSLYDYYSHHVHISVNHGEYLINHTNQIISSYQELYNRLKNFDDVFTILYSINIHQDVVNSYILPLLEF